MKKKEFKILYVGIAFIILFVVWTFLIQLVDVKPIGQNNTIVGFATLNNWFHKLIGTNMTLYNITDWLGLVPLFVCFLFGSVGLVQLIKRKSLLKVDCDIILLGVYYVVVIFCYIIFEMIPINYRPILINGFLEASYPSSTTLLVLSVMPTLVLQVNRRAKNDIMRKIIAIITMVFSVFMITGRLVSGVHWFTDIIGSILLSAGLFYVYKGIILLRDKEN